MRFSPRLARRIAPFGNQVEEIARLRAILSDCPGVKSVESISPHRKGGYVAVMDFSMDQLDGFLERLEGAGWMGVL
jgi:hypothetical protein